MNTPALPRTREQAAALDAADPLAPLRDTFLLPEGTIYLDGNSLGVLPAATPGRVAQVVRDEWGRDLITSWNRAGWVSMSQRVGDEIAPLIGARAGEVRVADSTSVNLFKALSVALQLQIPKAGPEVRRRRIVSERGNFPADLYIAETLARQHGAELVLVDDAAALQAALDDRLAVLMLTHVNYRSGALHDMAGLTAQAHAAGALVVWDLAHSAGAVPVDLHAAGADFAVGCGYKYLNGGPGAPAFIWAHPAMLARMDAQGVRQPLSGWFGHAAPFVFETAFTAAAGMDRFLCGTPPVLSLAALACGVASVRQADALGGMAALRRKSIALTGLFIEQVQQRLAAHGIGIATPLQAGHRGSQVSLTAPAGQAWPLVQALIERRVVGDFRAGDAGRGEPDLMRFGFTPLYLRHVDAWDAVQHLEAVLASGEWRAERFQRRAAVT